MQAAGAPEKKRGTRAAGDPPQTERPTCLRTRPARAPRIGPLIDAEETRHLIALALALALALGLQPDHSVGPQRG